ncbi:MAG: hypothetical protein C3F02_02985 [Parcubacteria group bacterium]|nr:MAG: hypothetical protein C3F02_02985 [Parcubacteria group bacterium]
MFYWGILLLFVIDRVTKLIFFISPSLSGSRGGFISFSINPHMAFSWPMIAWMYYPLAVIILFFLFYYADKSRKNKSIMLWPWSLIIIGAISNLIDRLFYHGVIDFLSWPNFFVFNLADSYITIGVVWLLLFNLPKSKKDDSGLTV